MREILHYMHSFFSFNYNWYLIRVRFAINRKTKARQLECN